jgi:hypothetical protein
MKAKSSELKKNYFVPRDLARMVKCSEKRIRQYCKAGKIPEAKRTPGGQLRILKNAEETKGPSGGHRHCGGAPGIPLSRKTRAFLDREGWRIEWRGFRNGKEIEGDVEPECTSSLMLAHVLDREHDNLYDAEIAESDLPPKTQNVMEQFDRLLDQSETEKAKRIIAKRKGKPFTQPSTAEKRVRELKLHGWVKQFYLKHRRRPTVAEVAEMMGISRSTFSRHGLTSKKLKHAYRIVVGELLVVGLEARDADSIERARKAKKPGFDQLRNDYDPQSPNFAP